MAVGVLCLAFGARAAGYDVAMDWDKVSSASYQNGTVDLTSANGWTISGGVATVANKVIKVNDEDVAVGKLVYTPVDPKPVKNRQVVEMHFPTVDAGAIPEAMTGAKGAIAAAVDGNTVTNWYGWCADGWTKLVGATPPPTDGCDVRMAFSNDVGKVCYAVNTGSGWVELMPEGAASGWLSSGAAPATGVGNVAFLGRTSLTNVTLTQVGTVMNTPTMTKRMGEQGVTEEAMNVVANNGNRNWENLVLGLTGSEPASKPVVRPVQTSNASKLTLALGGVNVDTNAGATVTYTVTASEQIGGAGTTTDPIAYNANACVGLPSSGTMYYRMTVTTTPGN